MAGPDADSDRLIRDFAESEEFSGVLSELDSFAKSISLSSQGCVHNLDESFARVNTACFVGKMAKLRLVWNLALTGRKFGHYRPSTDTVILSASLDASEIPALTVDFVMYDELLHKKHGVTLGNGRRLVHTAAFQAGERRFADFQEAERSLNGLARKG